MGGAMTLKERNQRIIDAAQADRRQNILCRPCLIWTRELKARQGKRAFEKQFETWDFVVKQCTACAGTGRNPIPIEEVINCR